MRPLPHREALGQWHLSWPSLEGRDWQAKEAWSQRGYRMLYVHNTPSKGGKWDVDGWANYPKWGTGAKRISRERGGRGLNGEGLTRMQGFPKEIQSPKNYPQFPECGSFSPLSSTVAATATVGLKISLTSGYLTVSLPSGVWAPVTTLLPPSLSCAGSHSHLPRHHFPGHFSIPVLSRCIPLWLPMSARSPLAFPPALFPGLSHSVLPFHLLPLTSPQPYTGVSVLLVGWLSLQGNLPCPESPTHRDPTNWPSPF